MSHGATLATAREERVGARGFSAAGAEGIIRELRGIGGGALSNPRGQHCYQRPLVIQAASQATIKKRSVGRGSRKQHSEHLGRVFFFFFLEERTTMTAAKKPSKGSTGGGGGTVESPAYAKRGRRCVNTSGAQRNIFIHVCGRGN